MIANATMGAVTAQLQLGSDATLSHLFFGDVIKTGLTFGTNTLTPDNGVLDWHFDQFNHTLSIETTDDGVATNTIVLTLTGITSLTMLNGDFTIQ